VRPTLATPLRAALSLALGALLALAPAPASATTLAPTARERSQVLLAEGDTDAANGAWDQAISKYRASYYGLTAEDQASYVGSLPVRKAMRAYAERIAKEQDPSKRRALLQRQRVLLDEFLDAVAAKDGATAEVGDEVIAELAETRRSIDAALEEPKAEPPVDPQQDPSTDPAQPSATEESPTGSTPTDTPKPPRDWLGLGLVIGGSTTLATGLGVTVGWWTIRNAAQDNVDAGGEDFAPGTQAREDYLASEEDRARKFLIAGSVVAGVGLATVIGGVIRLVVHRRRAASRRAASRSAASRSAASRGATGMHVVPLLSPGAGGLALHGRF
jgi:hypothetical protein